MITLKVILLAVALMAVAILGLAIRIVFKKNGEFPDTHIGSNKYLKKNGITCAQTDDKIEQAKANQKLQFKNLKLAEK